jgi:hypothetical protein
MSAYLRDVLLWIMAVSLLAFMTAQRSQAHDEDRAHDAWYHSLRQPDNPSVSCCGLADAYWADAIHVRDGKTYAVITDDRPDEPLARPHVDIGTEIEIPDAKLKWEQDGRPIGNPTGHSVVFLSYTRQVYCFVQSTGI